MGQIALQIPQVGLPDSTEDPKIASDLTAIQAVINGNLDSTNISAALAQSVGVNQAGQTMRGATNIAAGESTTSASYTTLTTPDQVTGIVLPVKGTVRVGYQALWQESVLGAARAAIFVGANQQTIQAVQGVSAGPATVAAATNASGAPAQNLPLFTTQVGLASTDALNNFSADVTTGQAIGFWGNDRVFHELNGATIYQVPLFGSTGGFCEFFAAAGTYTISVKFKASSGSVTASNRKLWVEAIAYA